MSTAHCIGFGVVDVIVVVGVVIVVIVVVVVVVLVVVVVVVVVVVEGGELEGLRLEEALEELLAVECVVDKEGWVVEDSTGTLSTLMTISPLQHSNMTDKSKNVT